MRDHLSQKLLEAAQATLSEQRREFARGEMSDLDDLEDAIAAIRGDCSAGDRPQSAEELALCRQLNAFREALEAIRAKGSHSSGEAVTEAAKIAAAALDAEVPQDDWVDCRTRMPEVGKDVLIYGPNSMEKVTGAALVSSGAYWQAENVSYSLDEITHWRPAPALPTEPV